MSPQQKSAGPSNETQSGREATEQQEKAHSSAQRQSDRATKGEANEETSRDKNKQEKATREKATPEKSAQEPGEHAGSANRAAGPNEKDRAGRNEKATQSERSANPNANRAEQSQGNGTENGGAARGTKTAEPDLTPAKRDRIREAVRKENIENISRADFDVTVGGIVPQRYHVHPLPAEIVSVLPEYRGYDYIVVNDEIVIVEPETHKIVYTVSESRSASASMRSTDCR